MQVSSIYLQMSRLAWRNVLRNWRHSLATTLAITSGFMAVSLFDGFIKKLEFRNNDGYSTRAMLGDVLIQKKDAQQHSSEDQWLYSLDAKDQQFLEDFMHRDPEIAQRVRFLNMTGMISSGQNNTIFLGYGYDTKEGAQIRSDRWAWNTTSGVPIDLYQGPSISLGKTLGLLLGCETTYTGPSFILEDGNYRSGDRPFTCKVPRVTLSTTTESAQVNAIQLPVSGLFDAGLREMDKRMIRISLADAQKLLDTDKITMVSVKLRKGANIGDFVKRLTAAARKGGFDIDAMPWQQHSIAAYIQGGLEILNVFRNLFMTIVVAIGVMSVANTMMKSVNERIREIGTLRSLGFLRRHIVWMFSLEGTYLSLIACTAGFVFSVLITYLVGKSWITYRAGFLSADVTVRIAWVPTTWILCAFSLSTLATVTAWLCARRASRMVIADAMRYV